MAARRPRVDVGRTEQQRVVDRFMVAISTGDVQALMDVLAPDVVVIADGGGIVTASRVPIHGIKKVVAFLKNFPKVVPDATIDPVPVNGAPGMRMHLGEHGETVVSVIVEDGRITRIFAMRNPEKLGRIDEATPLSR